MTVQELIDKLKDYDPKTKVQFDYGGSIVDVEEVFEINKSVCIG
jgi:hypothetical protein